MNSTATTARTGTREAATGTAACHPTIGTTAPPAKREALREGTTLGVVVATGTWVWVAVVDAVAGNPFQTFTVLGGLVPFTVMHFLLNITYGVVIVSALRGSARTPSLVIALVFGVVVLEIAFAMVTVLLSNLGLGNLAWVRIFGGSLIGMAIALVILSRQHPIVAQLHRAEKDE